MYENIKFIKDYYVFDFVRIDIIGVRFKVI